MSTVTRIGTLLALSLALVASACGGDGVGGGAPEVDEEELRAAAAETRDAAENALQDVVSSTSRDEAADALRSGAEELSAAADRLEEAEATPEAEDAKADLVAAARELAGAMERAAPDVETGSLADLARAANDVQSLGSYEELNRAVEELRAAGIDVPPPAR